jgi:tetratricopeptide (TPR) repeat protein
LTRAELAKIEEIKADATAARNLKDWDEALALFDEAIAMLHNLRKEVRGDESEARDIRIQLADTYGMKGGTYRRMQNLPRALTEYQHGLELERVDKLSTYNASNVITLGITLGALSPFDPQIQEDLDRVIAELKNATDGPRADEWWAWSDLGQFYLLRDRPDKAREAYRSAVKTGPTSDELIRHRQILAELGSATKASAPGISRNIDETIQFLRPQTG